MEKIAGTLAHMNVRRYIPDCDMMSPRYHFVLQMLGLFMQGCHTHFCSEDCYQRNRDWHKRIHVCELANPFEIKWQQDAGHGLQAMALQLY